MSFGRHGYLRISSPDHDLPSVSRYRSERPQKSDIPVIALGRDLHLDPRELSTQQLHLFKVSVSGKKAEFIVRRTPDEVIHVALASCKACYRNHNSHYAKNGEMICGECKGAMFFESKGQKGDPNHCALAELPHSETDRELIVSSRVVLAETAKLPQ
jgi:uncharacterized membrane protein